MNVQTNISVKENLSKAEKEAIIVFVRISAGKRENVCFKNKMGV